MNTYIATAKDGKTVEINTKKELTGVVMFKHEDHPNEWDYSVTSAKDPLKFKDSQANISGRDWLSDFHLASFTKKC